VLARFRLALVSGWYSLRLCERSVEEEFGAMQGHLALLRALGCEIVICAEVTGCIHGDVNARLSGRPRLSPRALEDFGRRLSELAERIHAADLRLAYHPHMGTVVQSEVDVDRLMSTTEPAVALLLDTGHLLFAGGDPIRIAEKHAARITHLHCKDVRPDVLRRCLNGDTSFLEAVLQGVFTVPGDGCIDFERVLAPLLAQGYSGWIVVEAEQDPTIANPVANAKLGFETLRRLIRD
jgi:inosose dehydratase